MTTTTIPVRTASATYDVHIGANTLHSVGASIETLTNGGLSSGKQKAFVSRYQLTVQTAPS